LADVSLTWTLAPQVVRSAGPLAGHRRGGRKSLASALWTDFAALGWRRVAYTWSQHALEVGLGSLVPGEIHLSDDEVSLVGARGVGTTLSKCW
jgi:hypothetical protein